MDKERDAFQRKALAIRKMMLATRRREQAQSSEEREAADWWIAAWGAVAGLRQFKLDAPGRRKTRRLSIGKLGCG